IVGQIAEFVGSILDAITDFLGPLGEVFGRAFGAAVEAVAGAVGQIGGLVGSVAGQFVALGGRIVAIVAGFIGQVVGFYLSIPGRIGGLVGTIGGQFVALGGRIVAIVAGFIGQVVGFFLALPGQVIGVGAEIVRGIIRGMAALPGQLLDAVAGAFRSLNIRIGPFHISAAGIRIELPSFATGVRDVPADMLAILHRGEMVVPAVEAAAVRAGAGIGGLRAVAAPAGAPALTVSMGDIVISAQSFAGSQAEARAFARSLFDLIEDEARRRGLRLAGPLG
ncbi:MAG TPA: hypothetical protein VLM76_04780, partial [Patescibacteria group bacterium]|nr:hypothetical protein [Patescibacteria group bacterium]